MPATRKAATNQPKPRTRRRPTKPAPPRPAHRQPPPPLDPALPIVQLHRGFATLRMPCGAVYGIPAERIACIAARHAGASAFNLRTIKLGEELALQPWPIPGRYRTPEGASVRVRRTGDAMQPTRAIWDDAAAERADAERRRAIADGFTVRVPPLDELRAAAVRLAPPYADALDALARVVALWPVRGEVRQRPLRPVWDHAAQSVGRAEDELWRALCEVPVSYPGNPDAIPPRLPETLEMPVIYDPVWLSESHPETAIHRLAQRVERATLAGRYDDAARDRATIAALRADCPIRDALVQSRAMIAREVFGADDETTAAADLPERLSAAAAMLRAALDSMTGHASRAELAPAENRGDDPESGGDGWLESRWFTTLTSEEPEERHQLTNAKLRQAAQNEKIRGRQRRNGFWEYDPASVGSYWPRHAAKIRAALSPADATSDAT